MRPRAPVAPWRFFFPAAAAHALLAVPLWLLARGGALPAPDFPSGATWHAAEMVFGYAFAVIAGYLLPASSAARVALLVAAWLAGRSLWPLAPHVPAWLPPVVASAFPLALAAMAVTRFRGAKRPRNRIFAAVFVAFAVTAILANAAAALEQQAAARAATLTALHLLVLLVVVMGGRLIPTATVGALRDIGRVVVIRAQPRRESACVALALAFVLVEAAPLAPAWSAAPAFGLGLVLLARMKDWRSAATWRLPEIWPLHLGYAWLALGFLMAGASRAGLAAVPVESLHALAVGGVGAVTLAMLSRLTRLRTGAGPAPAVPAACMHGLLAAATVARVFGGLLAPEWGEAALWLAAILWALAFAVFLWLFALHVHDRGATRPRGDPPAP